MHGFCANFHSSNQESLSSGENAAVSNDSVLAGLSRAGADTLKSVDNIDTLENLTKDSVATIEPGGLLEGDEELGAVCVGARVGHGEEVGLGVLEIEVLVWEGPPVDRFTSSAAAFSEVSSLGHEARDDAVEMAALEMEGLACVANASLSSRERGEILHSLRHHVAEHAKDYAPSRVTVHLDVKVYLFSHFSKGLI